MRTEREIVLEELAKAGANIEQARDLLTSVDLDIWRACSELSKGVGHLELAVDRLMTVSKEALNKVLDREA